MLEKLSICEIDDSKQQTPYVFSVMTRVVFGYNGMFAPLLLAAVWTAQEVSKTASFEGLFSLSLDENVVLSELFPASHIKSKAGI